MTVFTSFGTSLETWREAGLLEPEAKYLRMLADRVGDTVLLTYGHPGEASSRLAETLSPVVVAPNRTRTPILLRSIFSPFTQRSALRASSVLRTNQLRGAWTAAIAARMHRKPLVVRTGYVWSEFHAAARGPGLRHRVVRALERFAISTADAVIVASERDRNAIEYAHPASSEKLSVVPNPVDTDLFTPGVAVEKQPGLVTFVGRLEEQKNIGMLIDVFRQGVAGGRLRIVGDGSMRTELELRAKGLDIEFTGAVQNRDLPRMLAESEVFALPSTYEGTPKALLEAMACGVAVVATDVPGNREVISDRINGVLAPADAAGFGLALSALLGDATARAMLGENARQHVNSRHSMTAAADAEASIINQVIERRKAASSAQEPADRRAA